MAMIRAVLHTYSGPRHEPAAVLGYINRHFRYLWNDAMFATAIYAVVDAASRTLRLSCAGHPPPMLVRDGLGVAPLPVEATMPLLFNDLGNIPYTELSLQAGDRLLFYTDGITDREDPDGAAYEVERLTAALDDTRSLRPSAAIDYVVGDLDCFAGGHEPDDDQTLLLLGFN